MKTKRQEEMINSFLSGLEEEIRPLYQDIIQYLVELGYHPQKEKSSISFQHDLHNKQIAKMGTKGNKMKGPAPFFSLRFSACRGYSQRFAGIIGAYMVKYPARASRCANAGCTFCAGEAGTHVYTYTFPGGESKSHCGAYAIEIPDIAVEDMPEIRRLIKEEHDYLLKHEAGIVAV